MRDIRQEVEETRIYMSGYGYRPATATDLMPGRELLMVEVERFFGSTRHAGWKPDLFPSVTRIKLADEPTKVTGHRQNDEPTVYFHCVMPPWDGDCFVGLNHITRDGYADFRDSHDPYANDTRYFVKK
jgi:hypothetical protein